MSVNEAIKKIEEDRSARLNELIHARALAVENDRNASGLYLCRAWVVMIFAHCEGYVKSSLDNFVLQAKSKWKKEDYIYLYGLFSLLYKSDPREIFSNSDKSSVVKGGKEIYMTITSGKKVDDVIKKTLGNVGFSYQNISTLCGEILEIGINVSKYEGFFDSICKDRHSIVHGDETPGLDVEHCIQLHNEAVQFIHEFGDAICDRLEQL